MTPTELATRRADLVRQKQAGKLTPEAWAVADKAVLMEYIGGTKQPLSSTLPAAVTPRPPQPPGPGQVQQRDTTFHGPGVVPAIPSQAARPGEQDRQRALVGLAEARTDTSRQGYAEEAGRVREEFGAPSPPTTPLGAVGAAMARQRVPGVPGGESNSTSDGAGLPTESNAWRALRQLGWMTAPAQEFAMASPAISALPVEAAQAVLAFRSALLAGDPQKAVSALSTSAMTAARDALASIGFDPLTGKNVFTGEKVPTVEDRVMGTTPEMRGLTWGAGKGGVAAAWYNMANKVAISGNLGEDMAAIPDKQQFKDTPYALARASMLHPGGPVPLEESQDQSYRLAGLAAELFLPTGAEHALAPIASGVRALGNGAKTARAAGFSPLYGAWQALTLRGSEIAPRVVADLKDAALTGHLGEAVRQLAPETQAAADALVRSRTGKTLDVLFKENDALRPVGPANRAANPAAAHAIFAEAMGVADDVGKVLAQKVSKNLSEAEAVHIGQRVWLPRETAQKVFKEADELASLYGVDLAEAARTGKDLPVVASLAKTYGGIAVRAGASAAEHIAALHTALAAKRAEAVVDWAHSPGLGDAITKGIRAVGGKIGKPLDLVLTMGSSMKEWTFPRFLNKGLLPEGVTVRLRTGPFAKAANNSIDIVREVVDLAKQTGKPKPDTLVDLAKGWSPSYGTARQRIGMALSAMAPRVPINQIIDYPGLATISDKEVETAWQTFTQQGFVALEPLLQRVTPTTMQVKPEEAALGFLARVSGDKLRREAVAYTAEIGLGLDPNSGVAKAYQDIAANGVDVSFNRPSGTFGYTEADAYAAARLHASLGHPLFDTSVVMEGLKKEGETTKVLVAGVLASYIDDMVREGIESPETARSLAKSIGGVAATANDALQAAILVGPFGTRGAAYTMGVVLGHPFTAAITQAPSKALSMFGTMISGGISKASEYRPLALDLTRRLEGPTNLFQHATTDARLIGPRNIRVDEFEEAMRRLGVVRQTTPLHSDHLLAMLDIDPTSAFWSWLQKPVKYGFDKLSWARSTAQRLAAAGEIYGRVSVALSEIERGASLEQAAMTAREALYSLDRMTPIERTLFRRAFLFYSFQRADAVNTFYALAQHPDRVLNALNYFRLQPTMWGVQPQDWAQQPGTTQYKLLLWMSKERQALPRMDGSADPRKAAWMILSPTVAPSSLFEMWADPDPGGHISPFLLQGYEQYTGKTPGSSFLAKPSRDVLLPGSREMQIPSVLTENPYTGLFVQMMFHAGLKRVEPGAEDSADTVMASDRAPAKWVAGGDFTDPTSPAAEQSRRLWLLASGTLGMPWVSLAKRLGEVQGGWRKPWIDDPARESFAATVGFTTAPLTKGSEQLERERERQIREVKEKTAGAKSTAE